MCPAAFRAIGASDKADYFFGRPAGFSSEVATASADSPQRSRILAYVPSWIRWFSPAWAAAANPLSFLVVAAMLAFSGQPPSTRPTSLVLASEAALYAAVALGPKVRSARPDWMASWEAESSS